MDGQLSGKRESLKKAMGFFLGEGEGKKAAHHPHSSVLNEAEVSKTTSVIA